jgi:hypothetical protein
VNKTDREKLAKLAARAATYYSPVIESELARSVPDLLAALDMTELEVSRLREAELLCGVTGREERLRAERDAAIAERDRLQECAIDAGTYLGERDHARAENARLRAVLRALVEACEYKGQQTYPRDVQIRMATAKAKEILGDE